MPPRPKLRVLGLLPVGELGATRRLEHRAVLRVVVGPAARCRFQLGTQIALGDLLQAAVHRNREHVLPSSRPSKHEAHATLANRREVANDELTGLQYNDRRVVRACAKEPPEALNVDAVALGERENPATRPQPEQTPQGERRQADEPVT